MAIYVYNRNLETHSGPNNFRIYRPFLLGNLWTHIKDKKTKTNIYSGIWKKRIFSC